MSGGEHWDTVVVGAGLGGLCAAGALAAAGQRVLVLERGGHVGGTATTYSMAGFGFPRGPLGFSTPSVLRDALGAEGAAPTLEMHRVRYLLRAFGLRVPLSLPFPELSLALSAAFPGEAAGIERFFSECLALADELRDARDDGRPASIDPALDVAASTYLDRTIGDPALRRLLGSMGSHQPAFGLPLLAAMWDLMCNVGICYPEGGLNRMCERFAGLDGGAQERPMPEIRLDNPVRSITVSRGRATGVLLADGSPVAADAVVSNADFKTTFLVLLAPRDLPEDWRAAVALAGQTGSVFQVGVGVDAGAMSLDAFDEGGRLIYRREGAEDAPAPRWSEPEIDPELLARQEFELALLSGDDARLAPAGHATLIIRTAADYRHFAGYRGGAGGRKPGYAGYKLLLARALVSEAAGLLPGLGDAVRVLDVATPLTFENEGGRYEGAAAGWSQAWQATGDYRRRELVRTPVAGLFMAGYQAFTLMYPGGVPGAVESGVRAARAVLDGAPPVDEVIIPRTRV